MKPKKTHCIRGHSLVPENLDTRGKCKECVEVRSRAKGHKPWSELKKTHCVRGHARTPENVNKSGGCLECKKINGAEYAKRKEVRDKQKEYKNGKGAEIWKKYTQSTKYKARARELQTTPRFLEMIRIKNRKRIAELDDRYVAAMMGLKMSEVTAEIIELKRSRLAQKRELRELKKAIQGG